MRLPPSSPPRLKAFSLIELLIAIAVVAILLALLFPHFQTMQEASRNAKCVTNLRNLGAAGLLYSADRQGRLPDRGQWPTGTETAANSLLSYLNIPLRHASSPVTKMKSALTCPSAMRLYPPNEQDWFRTYSINQYSTGSESGSASIVVTWEDHVKNRNSPLRLQNVKNPAAQAFFMDGTLTWEGTYRFSAFQAPDRLTPVTQPEQPGWRTPWVHNDRINVVYLDGHIESISLGQGQSRYISPTNSAGSKRTDPFWGAGL